MVDIRKVIIIFVVAILFAVLVFSVIEAVSPQPDYNDYCDVGIRRFEAPKPVAVDCPTVPVPMEERTSCEDREGQIVFTNLDESGCATSYECNTCQREYDEAREVHSLVVFYVSAVLALIAIFVGMFLPAKQDSLNEWIGTGFMLGGVFALFFGTIMSFNDLHRFVRPVVIFLELALILFMAYRKVGNLRKDKK